jgi:t-SNARE complex subunit (syntaxin)
MIQEREAEIREIETGIHELSEIFRDLGTLVHEQGGMIGQSSLRSFHFLYANRSRNGPR